MSQENAHVWVVGPVRAVRTTGYPQFEDRRTIHVDCHRGLYGPFSGSGKLIRQLADEVMDVAPELAERYSLVVLTVAPELKTKIKGIENLTTMAEDEERTRFFSHHRLTRIAHGLIDFLIELTDDSNLGKLAIVFENVQQADRLDREFLRHLLRRARPERLSIVLSSTEHGVGEELQGDLRSYSHRVDVSHELPALADVEQHLALQSEAERKRIGWQFVQSDCTSDDPYEHLAYEMTDASERARWHDQRAEALEAMGVGPWTHGAYVLHRERGTDAQKGIEVLVKTVSYCMYYGCYEALIEFADRGRALLGDAIRDLEKDWFFIYMKIQALSALGRTDEAEDLCLELQMVATAPIVQMRVAYMLSMLYTRHRTERDHQVALAWAQVSIAIASGLEDPKKRAFYSVFLQNGLALVELHRGHYEQALKLVTEGYERLNQELASDEHRLHRSVLLYNRGQILSRQRRYEEALEIYNQVIAIDPNYPEYHFDLGNIHNLLGHYEEALNRYNSALAVSPPFPEVYLNRGQLYKKLGRLAEALADFNYLLEMNPDDPEALLQRGSLLCENGLWQEARQDLEHALTLDPQQAQLLALLGMVEMEEGHLQEALTAYTSALDADPTHVEAWTNRAVVRFELDDPNGAIDDLTHALALGENATVLYNRAWAYQAVEDWEQAINDYTEALLLPDADAMDVFYQRGLCYLQAGREAEGLQDWKKHLELADGTSPYQEEIATKAPMLVS